jgi:glycosyltransferase involved in cell wall biosynthesis
MKIALLAPVLSARDAVGTDVLDMAAALRQAGHEVRVYAEHTEGIAEGVFASSGLAAWASSAGDLVIYHCSIGWPRALELLQRLRCRRHVRYHNITPPEFFYGISRDHVRACAAGRAALPQLAALDVERWLPCSDFNAGELIALGVEPRRIAVLPPFNRIETLRDTPADLETLDRYRDGACTWLNVGRLAPNKDHATLIDAFACYLRQVDAHARLIVVGKHDPRLRRYTRSLRGRIAAHGIAAQVHLLDDVSEAVLKACYLVADALVITSRHEGFCVPLAEAMALSVPIVTRDAAAITTTVGDAGLVWDSDDSRLYAASVARLKRDGEARAQLTALGRARYRNTFAADVLARQLLQHVGVAP